MKVYGLNRHQPLTSIRDENLLGIDGEQVDVFTEGAPATDFEGEDLFRLFECGFCQEMA